MDYFQFMGRVKNRFFSVYLFKGEEDFLKDRALKRLENALFRQKKTGEKDVFEGDINAGSLNEELKTAPLFSKARLIVIKNTGCLNKDSKEVLLQYIKNPLSLNFLVVFLDKGEDIKKWGADSSKVAFVEFKKFYESDMLNWLLISARYRKKFLSRDIAGIFLERIGPDLALLSAGFERVLDYTGEKKAIEKEDVEKILGDEKRDAIFDLTDALAAQDIPSCLKILNNLFLFLTSPQQIIALLSRQIRQLYTIKKGGELKIPSFFLRRMKEDAKRFTEDRLEECLYRLRKADCDIKSGLANPRLSLELFFFKFLESGEAKT